MIVRLCRMYVAFGQRDVGHLDHLLHMLASPPDVHDVPDVRPRFKRPLQARLHGRLLAGRVECGREPVPLLPPRQTVN